MRPAMQIKERVTAFDRLVRDSMNGGVDRRGYDNKGAAR